MKIRLQHMILVVALGMISPAGIHFVQAQDGTYPTPESYDDVDPERDRVIYAPGEGDPMLTTKTQMAPSRDSVSFRQSSPVIRPQTTPGEATRSNTAKQPAKEQDDSVLSFNILYYLFEKYKLQDIVD